MGGASTLITFFCEKSWGELYLGNMLASGLVDSYFESCANFFLIWSGEMEFVQVSKLCRHVHGKYAKFKRLICVRKECTVEVLFFRVLDTTFDFDVFVKYEIVRISYLHLFLQKFFHIAYWTRRLFVNLHILIWRSVQLFQIPFSGIPTWRIKLFLWWTLAFLFNILNFSTILVDYLLFMRFGLQIKWLLSLFLDCINFQLNHLDLLLTQIFLCSIILFRQTFKLF